MNHLDLFSGIGGFSYAAQQIWKDDHNIIAFVEKDKYCQRVLKKHWPNIPIIDDVRGFNYEKFTDVSNTESTDGKTSKNTEGWSQMQSGRGSCRSGTAKIDLLTGGFPCQPFSVAGKRKGKADDRYLWPEMLRVIQEAKPRWIIGENVPGIINMGLETTVLDLEGEGYEVELLVLSACGIGSWHKRDRVWIVAHSNSNASSSPEYRGNVEETEKEERVWKEHRSSGNTTGTGNDVRRQTNKRHEAVSDVSDTESKGSLSTNEPGTYNKEFTGVDINKKEIRSEVRSNTSRCGEQDGKEGDVSDTDTERLQGAKFHETYHGKTETQHPTPKCLEEEGDCRPVKPKLGDMADGLSAQLGKLGVMWDSEPDIPRVAIGIKDRVKKLKALGNAIVPQCVMPIMWAIREIDDYEENRRGNTRREIA